MQDKGLGLLIPVKGNCNATAKEILDNCVIYENSLEKNYMGVMIKGAETFGRVELGAMCLFFWCTYFLFIES